MTDQALQVWSLLSDMSDGIIEESIIPAEAEPTASKRRRRFSTFMNHPAMVAVLCAVVSLGVVAAIVMAGRGAVDSPLPHGTAFVETPFETLSETPIETADPSDAEPIPADFASYVSIVRMYRKMVEVSPDWARDDKREGIDALFSFPDEQAKEWYTAISKSVMLFYPQDAMLNWEPDGYLTFGFALKDIDGDRAHELILLAEDYTMVALFTTRDEKPVLLEIFGERRKGYVNEGGKIMIAGSSGADVNSQEIYSIDAAEGRLIFEEAIGRDGHTEDLEILYYHRAGEEKAYISEAEFTALAGQMPYASFGIEQNEALLKDDYTHLFVEPLFGTYDDVLEIFRQLLLCENSAEQDALERAWIARGMTDNDRLLLSLLSTDVTNFKNRDWIPAYTFKDLDGDGQEELILLSEDLWVFGLYTMADGAVKDLGYAAAWGMNMGFVAADGMVCQVYLSKGQNETIKIQRLANGELVTVEEFGVIDEKVWVDFGAESTGDEEIYFYRMVNGERQKIDADTYRALARQYGTDTMSGYSTDAGFTTVLHLFLDNTMFPIGKG